MSEKIKRAFYGYNPKDFDNELVRLNEEFAASLKSLEKELSEVEDASEELLSKIKLVKDDVEKYKNLRNEISERLYKSYMHSVEEVYNTMFDSELEEITIENKISSQVREKMLVEEMIKGIREEMKQKLDEYKNKFNTNERAKER